MEIIRLGPTAVEAYRKALEEGKQKTPYYGLLILGESKVGKTSLYRQLIGKPFRSDLESTKGIDNNTVDIMVDERRFTMGDSWHESKGDTAKFAQEIGKETQRLMPLTEVNETKENSFPCEAKLLHFITEIQKSLKPRSFPLHPAPQPVPRASYVEHHSAHTMQVSPDNFSPSFVPSAITFTETTEVVPAEPRRTVALPKATSETNPDPTYLKEKSKPLINIDEIEDRVQPQVPVSTSKPEQKVNITEKSQDKRPGRQLSTDGAVGISPFEGNIIASYTKRRIERVDRNEELTLNALDFAGQHEYRPMHHCFITRRACYLVVFKLPTMVEFIDEGHRSDQSKNPWEELRYWVHSINAHIYPSDEQEKEEMKKSRRVILVGTHREDVDIDNLKNVDGFLKKKINPDSRCVDLVKTVSYQEHPSGVFCPNYFIAVENSIDKSTNEYLIKSGTSTVQKNNQCISKDRPELDEDHPIKWLKFKECIEVKSTSTPVLSMKELSTMAASCQILKENDQQKYAIRFLHECGIIICLEHLPHLFLNREERKELEDKVVIRPQWLISVMKEIMKLDVDEDNEGIKKSLVIKFAEHGVANEELLKMCWREYLPSSRDPSGSKVATA